MRVLLPRSSVQMLLPRSSVEVLLPRSQCKCCSSVVNETVSARCYCKCSSLKVMVVLPHYTPVKMLLSRCTVSLIDVLCTYVEVMLSRSRRLSLYTSARGGGLLLSKASTLPDLLTRRHTTHITSLRDVKIEKYLSPPYVVKLWRNAYLPSLYFHLGCKKTSVNLSIRQTDKTRYPVWRPWEVWPWEPLAVKGDSRPQSFYPLVKTSEDKWTTLIESLYPLYLIGDVLILSLMVEASIPHH